MVKKTRQAKPNLVLRMARKERGWTQRKVAERIGAPLPLNVTRWESGLTVPSPYYIERLCELFERSPRELGLLRDDEYEPLDACSSTLTAFPPPPKLQASLPIQTSPLIGREQEVKTICALLRQPEVRLLTVTGTGGVGKTRLALHIASELQADFADGVCFISLATLSDPDLFIATLVQALGLTEVRDRSTVEHLQALLHRKHLLLLLDNFEQIVAAAPHLVEVLAVCPQLKVLVTSRCVLHVRGEYEFLLSPLALPNLTYLPTHQDLSQVAAVALFLYQMRRRMADFQLTPANAESIAEVCVRLEGLPLALELAAARSQLFSPQTLLARLGRRLPLLTGGTRDAPERQQTLRKTIDWSYHLLTARQRRLFQRMSVFVGGATLEAIEMVCGAGEKQEGQLVDAVSKLLDQSLLQVQRPEGEEPRFWMLETIREYAWECLVGSEEKETMQHAHALYYLALAEEAEPALRGPQILPWLARLEREYENLREALCWLVAQTENGLSTRTELALRLGTALEGFWIIRGHVKEERGLLEWALKRSAEGSASLRGKALLTQALLASHQGDLPTTVAACEEALTLFRELEDPLGSARSLYSLGYVAWMRGDYATARTYYEESLAISRRAQCKEAISETLLHFGSLNYLQGDARTSCSILEESLKFFRERGDRRNIASVLNMLGLVRLLQRDAQAANILQQESLAICRMLGNQRGVAHALGALGHIAARTGDLGQAYQCYEESLKIMILLGDRWMVVVFLEGLARVALVQGEATWAVYLLSAANVLRQVIGALMTPLEQVVHEHTLTRLHNLLDEHAFAAAWVQGQAMSPEQALEARRLLQA
ncbi:MAG: tetratricopeptide repeat protein [Chloroflexi bacterium]|nr:tetratricopeptide repeat protein [Chloroflexota bacterium]